VLLAVLGLLALAASLAVIEGIVLLGVRSDLEAGRNAARNARSAFARGDASEAGADFDRAETRFSEALAETRTTIGRAAAWIPFAGNSVDVASGLAGAGVHVARAGQVLTEAIGSLPEGLGSLAPSGGRLPLGNFGTLSEAVGQARIEAEAALDAVERTPTSFVPEQVLTARWDAERDVTDAVRALRAGDLLLSGLPSFAGGEGVRRYLVMPQNPAELRGSGGFWGAYAVLTFREGRPSFSPVRPTSTLPAVTADQIPPPNPDYRGIYDQFGGAASWENMNMSPDFPSVARAALGNYAAAVGTHLDGVIAADPFALRPMLALTGPVPIPGLHRTIDADNVVPFTTNQAYLLFANPAQSRRKEVVGAAATGVLERFIDIEGRGVARLRAVAEAARGGHLLVYSTDDAFEQGLDLAGAAGTFAADDGGDLMAVTVNNATAAKIDFWSTRRIRYAVSLGGDHEENGDLQVTIHNGAPMRGVPRYLIGPGVPSADPGDEVLFLSASCHAPCDLTSSERDGTRVPLTAGSELGIPWFRDYTTIPSGETGSWSLDWHTSGVWDGNSSGGTYRLTYLGQPTIRPTTLDLRVQAPPGTRVVWTNVPMTLDGGVATWEGTPQPRAVFVVRFRAPLPLRLLRDVTRPVFG
jgi:Protein of unknown function (DUF4012)